MIKSHIFNCLIRFHLTVSLLLISCSSCTHFLQSPKPDIAYTEFTHLDQKIFKLEFNPEAFHIIPVRAKSEGREPMSSMVSRNQAIAGINGGFFHADGKPAGIYKLNGQIESMPVKQRGVVGWNRKEQELMFDRIQSLDGELQGDYLGTLWTYTDHIIGGTPLLIYNGESITDHSIEKTNQRFLFYRFARTALCTTNDKRVIFMVTEGSSTLDKEHMILRGLTISELTDLMKSFGCQYALNLDGGGSSTMIYKGSVKNPLEEERPVSDGIIIKRKATGL